MVLPVMCTLCSEGTPSLLGWGFKLTDGKERNVQFGEYITWVFLLVVGDVVIFIKVCGMVAMVGVSTQKCHLVHWCHPRVGSLAIQLCSSCGRPWLHRRQWMCCVYGKDCFHV